jgi:hypothetical protein
MTASRQLDPDEVAKCGIFLVGLFVVRRIKNEGGRLWGSHLFRHAGPQAGSGQESKNDDE